MQCFVFFADNIFIFKKNALASCELLSLQVRDRGHVQRQATPPPRGRRTPEARTQGEGPSGWIQCQVCVKSDLENELHHVAV